ncbi:hypothetical protein V7S43_013538 [Phytophthora oleae]|uniref:Uncharacterized protein n=1 Tax=Phytophthora oleae TaxID=2107226 RepID=A0ABD3F3I8_9STRA
MQTPPPHMTIDTLVDDIVRFLTLKAGGRCGRVLLAPNSYPQLLNIASVFRDVQKHKFMQDVAQVAFKNDEQHLATTYGLTAAEVQQSVPIKIVEPPNGEHRLFY